MLDLDEELYNYKVKATQNISNLVSKSSIPINNIANIKNTSGTYDNLTNTGPRLNTLIVNTAVIPNSNYPNAENLITGSLNLNQDIKQNQELFLPGYGEKISNKVTLAKPQLDSCPRAQYNKALNSEWASIESIKKTCTAPKRQFFPTISSDYCELTKKIRDQKIIKDNKELIGIKKIGLTNMGTSINFERTTNRDTKDINCENGDKIPVIKSCSLNRAKKNHNQNFPQMVKRKILSTLTDDLGKCDNSENFQDQKG